MGIETKQVNIFSLVVDFKAVIQCGINRICVGFALKLMQCYKIGAGAFMKMSLFRETSLCTICPFALLIS